MATSIVVYERNNQDTFVTRMGTVLATQTTDHVMFDSELRLAGGGFYIMTTKPDETGLARFHELEISHSGRGAVLSYICKIGRAWSGYVGASPTEGKKANGEEPKASG